MRNAGLPGADPLTVISTRGAGADLLHVHALDGHPANRLEGTARHLLISTPWERTW